MGKYGVHFTGFATTTAFKTALSLAAGTAGEEGEILEVIMTGSNAAAADRQHECRGAYWDGTTAGTGTARVPEPMHQQSSAAALAVAAEYSAEPTNINTVYPILFGFNQRGGMRWAVPEGQGIKVRETDTEDGFVIGVISDAAGSVSGSMQHVEP